MAKTMANNEPSSMEEQLELDMAKALSMENPSHDVEEQSGETNEEPPLKNLKLKKDSEVDFDWKQFEAHVTNGEWDEAEKYLSGFLTIDKDETSLSIFFDIRQLKYIEAVDRKDYSNAVEILNKDLKFFAVYNQNLFTELTLLLTLKNFRDNEKLSNFGDTESSRANLLKALKSKLENYDFFRSKHESCDSDNSKLTTPVNQSCSDNSMANPLGGPGGSCARIPARTSITIRTMVSEKRNHIASYSIPNPLKGSTTTIPATASPGIIRDSNDFASNYMPDVLTSFNTTLPARASPGIIGNWKDFASNYISDLLTSYNPTIPALVPPVMPTHDRNPITSASFRTPTLMSFNPTIPALASRMTHVRGFMPGPYSVPNQVASSQPWARNSPAVKVLEPPVKLQKLAGTVEKVNDSTANTLPHMHADDLPQTAIVTFYHGSKVQSLDFHPVKQTLLLVGTANGDISMWEMGGTEWLVCQPFKIWDIGACSLSVQASFANDSTAVVNRVIWSPEGDFFGVAYSRHLVHIYSYNGDDLEKHTEIDAHFGNVYDISFSNKSTSLCVITCGEDKAIRMWMSDGGNRFSLVYDCVGHNAPVYSLCPCEDEKKYLFSVDTTGKINAWIYGTKLFTCNACPSWGRMACSADGRRLFFCGTDSSGDSFLVELDHREGGDVKHMYKGLRRRSTDVVQFDTANNRILAAGDEFQVKFWSLDSVKQLSYTYAAGGLPSCPCVRFNKGGTLLAVSTVENGVKVLANADGLKLLRSMEKCPVPYMKTLPIDDIAAEFATATDDEVVGGSLGFSSVQGQESSGFSSFGGSAGWFSNVEGSQSPGDSSGDSVEQPTC